MRFISLFLVLISMMVAFVGAYAGMNSAYLNVDHTGSDLYKKAVGFFETNRTDSALYYFELQIKVSPNADNEQRIRSVTAYNRIGNIYTNMGDYRSAYKNLIDGLVICDEYGLEQPASRIYTSIGNIYYYFGKYDTAKNYYLKALAMCKDRSIIDGYYNNAGMALTATGQMDSAIYFLSKASALCRKSDNNRSSPVYNSVATYYRAKECNDSAYHYYSLSLESAGKHKQVRYQIQNLSDLSSFFLEGGNIGDALACLNASDSLAINHGMLNFLASNNLIHANIEEARGNTPASLHYLRRYTALSDSISSADIFGDISLVQRTYETAKTDRQIEDLIVKQRIRDIIIYIALGFVIIITVGLLLIWRQKRSLHAAYTMLLDKNMEIINLKEVKHAAPFSALAEGSLVQAQHDSADRTHDALFRKIEETMADKDLICDPDFSVTKLAAHINSNQTYISQAITAATGKNFRTYLNEYRIQEAQLIFSSPEAARFTIETVALKVGFKSRNTFYNAFKEFVGVTPNFYLKSMQKRLNQ